ncbi:MAG: HigA family addiction module antidote protein [Chloroflexi bacterium]|nr:HigA family addiction module antidote protein [Chloroflexota bacterium]
MVRVPTNRAPTHPGEMLREEFLIPMNVTQRELANGIRVPYQRVNELINGKRGVTPSTALRLAKYFDTTPGFWMNLQLRWDLYRTQQVEARQLEKIEPYGAHLQVGGGQLSKPI